MVKVGESQKAKMNENMGVYKFCWNSRNMHYWLRGYGCPCFEPLIFQPWGTIQRSYTGWSSPSNDELYLLSKHFCAYSSL